MLIDLPPVVETVTVQAARLPPSPIDRAFAVVTVGPEAIATAPRLDEALTATPGVQLFRRTSSNASNPTTQGIGVRSIAGSGASRALVTLDGAPQNDPFGGWVIWSGLPPIGVEQARVVRGAGAGPYGAGALTGVIQLSERTTVPAHGEYEAYIGERGLKGGAMAVAAGNVLLTAAAEHSDGWVPVRAGRRPVDAALAFDAAGAAIRWAPGKLSVRLNGYRESRGSGLVGGNARVAGGGLTATVADTSPGIGTGWRLQGWARRSDLENRSVNRGSGLVTNEQYGTPALGVGFNAALRRDLPGGGWEVGADGRRFEGETRERFGAGLADGRISGGGQSVVGLYAEGYRQSGPWLLTGGARLDRWASFDGHRTQTGSAPLDERYAGRDGWAPTARLGARRDHEGGYLRAAAYAGFRPPTLNELYRPFVLGADVTLANPDLEPEKLYGADLGIGGEGWSLTGFYNRLEGAVANATISGTLRQRRNAGDIEAFGLEGEGRRRLGPLTVRLSGAYTQAEVVSGEAAGLRPAQTPRLSATAEATWRPVSRLALRGVVRHEGARFDDDRNTRKLGAATDISLRADWAVTKAATLYVAAENLTDAAIETAQAFDGTESFDAPRTLRVGLVLRP